MKFMQCQSTGCGKPFQVNQFTTRVINCYELGVIKCPHCGNAVQGDADSVFLTHALSLAQEAQFFNSDSLSNRISGFLPDMHKAVASAHPA